MEQIDDGVLAVSRALEQVLSDQGVALGQERGVFGDAGVER